MILLLFLVGPSMNSYSNSRVVNGNVVELLIDPSIQGECFDIQQALLLTSSWEFRSLLQLCWRTTCLLLISFCRYCPASAIRSLRRAISLCWTTNINGKWFIWIALSSLLVLRSIPLGIQRLGSAWCTHRDQESSWMLTCLWHHRLVTVLYCRRRSSPSICFARHCLLLSTIVHHEHYYLGSMHCHRCWRPFWCFSHLSGFD